MKTIILILTSAAFFLLDWAALHDIIKGNETNYTAEYVVIGISLIFYFTAGYYYIRKKKAIAAN